MDVGHLCMARTTRLLFLPVELPHQADGRAAVHGGTVSSPQNRSHISPDCGKGCQSVSRFADESDEENAGYAAVCRISLFSLIASRARLCQLSKAATEK